MNWQPIATAPLNTTILVTDGKDVLVSERIKKSNGEYFIFPAVFGESWGLRFEEQLTHWMPIPELPDANP